jgi:BirA family biotin operon repressor/biotin-[acetyl-CoA-carboxylase] ligase
VFHRRSTGSTNDDARALAASRLPLLDGASALVVAETQTKGRGRGANVWLSPEGSIALTITAPGVEARRLGVLPLGIGSCVVGALRQLGASAWVKWPNDILIEGGKVGGILCESSVLSGAARVFIGVGINVEALPPGYESASSATSLSAQGLRVDRPSLVADITARVLRLIRSEASNPEIVQEWKTMSVPWWGDEVTFIEGALERRVTLIDVNPEGQLVVRDEDAVIRSLASGEVRRIRTSGA